MTELLMAAGVNPRAILIEPEGCNTAPAVLAAALTAQAKDTDALLLAAPSDHVVPDTDAFRDTVQQGIPAAPDGRIATFGTVPDRPETGYGYLEPEVGEKTDPRP